MNCKLDASLKGGPEGCWKLASLMYIDQFTLYVID